MTPTTDGVLCPPIAWNEFRGADPAKVRVKEGWFGTERFTAWFVVFVLGYVGGAALLFSEEVGREPEFWFGRVLDVVWAGWLKAEENFGGAAVGMMAWPPGA
jgi:hypothetical protein